MRMSEELRKIHGYEPLALYLLFCCLTYVRQMQLIPDRRHPLLDARQGTNLTLVGFSFTVIGLLVTIFESKLAMVAAAVFLFSLSLGYFLGSYLLLLLRVRRFFDTMSEGLTIAGLWATLSGLRALFEAFEPLQELATIFVVLMWILGAYVCVDIFNKWKQREEVL
jgi:hypothetical protein